MARTIRTSTSTSARPARRLQRGAFAVLAGAGIVLAPAVAEASTAQAATTTAAAASSATAQNAVNVALAQVGKPYRYGAAGPDAFDCSGLTSFAYKAAGINLPRTTSGQRSAGTPVSRGALQPGDLVFFYGGGHASIYVGNNQVVHAATAGKPVNVINMDYMPYSSARRVA
jgi:cell wall-associated NlpC family hydrolase